MTRPGTAGESTDKSAAEKSAEASTSPPPNKPGAVDAAPARSTTDKDTGTKARTVRSGEDEPPDGNPPVRGRNPENAKNSPLG
ncbi:MAG: hypothetical protein WD794_01235 [Mycobacteriales bacterium]